MEVHYEDHDLILERTSSFWLEAPDPTASRLLVTPSVAAPGQPVTYVLELFNRGPVTGELDAIVKLPEALVPLSVTASSPQGNVVLLGNQLAWQGWLLPGEAVTITMVMKAPLWNWSAWLPATAILDDGMTDPVVVDTLLEFKPITRYLPLAMQGIP